ncbi:amino acid adenylation domain-containing protein [Agrobacterium vitis]|nr:amino acid adenylation domain-containing protein [Agrobacterium vitis]MBE1436376.1 amino acid adenylation domain-containing protein [Agrobacterium vitis]
MTEKNNGYDKRQLLKQLLLDGREGPKQQGIAIIGMSGRYPDAETLDQFWDNLTQGRDSVTEVPSERWRWQDHFDPQPHTFGKTYSRWGAFLTDVDKFDPLFFHISPAEAEGMDPQERLFLEASWQVLEDAGYTPARLTRASNRIGVFAGVMYGDYEWLSAQATTLGVETSAHAAYWSIANRVSYVLDLQGPSFAVDSACSSSLTAIHLACESIRRGECEAAIAGGVNLILHPMHYARLSGMLSTDGRCKSFGEGGNGFVAGEGVGAVLLKSLEQAEKDGDRIYAVIRGSAINAGGRTNGYTVPNPKAQGNAIAAALDSAGLSARRLSYIEAHGTGTALGDPIEIAGLASSFARSTQDVQFCAIGSVKSNIGHIESAAGVAGLTKVVLQLRHRELVPSLHSQALNPALELTQTPFRVQRQRQAWPQSPDGQPRLAGVSSFGGGGANAHIIIEEYIGQKVEAQAETGVIVLSARNDAALRRSAQRLADHIQHRMNAGENHDYEGFSLGALAHTLQHGREAMEERLSFIASSLKEVRDRLNDFARTGETRGIHRGSTLKDQSSLAAMFQGDAGDGFRRMLMAEKRLKELAELWAKGLEVDWQALNEGRHFKPISLPTYPFERKRYWISDLPKVAPVVSTQTALVDDPRGDFYYRPIWVPYADMPASEARGRTVVLAPRGSADLARTLARRTGAELLWLQTTNSPDALDLISDAGESVRLEGYSGPLDIYFLGGVQPEGIAPEDTAAISTAQNQGLLSLLRLSRILMRNSQIQPRLKIIANDVHDAFGTPSRNAQAAGLFGFAQVLATEQPAWGIAAFDLSFTEDLTIDTVSAWLLAQPWSLSGGLVLRRQGQSFQRRLEALDLPAVTTSAFRQNGVYLIIGGTGGIGRILTRHLVERYNARVVWVGRRTPDATVQTEMSALCKTSNQVSFIAADAAHHDDLVRVIAQVKALHGALNGVIHSAMDLQSATIAKSDEALFRAAIAVKTDGIAALARATAHEGLDFLALFSSSGAFGNWAGTAGYTAGVSFEDAVGRQLAMLRPYPVKVINWGYWGEVGSGARPGIKTMFDAKGVPAFSAEEGLEAIERILAGPASQVMPILAEAGVLQHMGLDETRKGEARPAAYSPVLHSIVPRLASLTPQSDQVYATWEAFDELEQISRPALLGVFQRMGVFRTPGERHDREALRVQLAIHGKFTRLYDALLGTLAESGYLTLEGAEVCTALDPAALPFVPGPYMEQLTARKEALLQRSPDIEATIQLIWIFLEDYPDILQGKRAATDIMFPGSSMKLVQGFYKGNALTDWYNTLVAHAVQACIEARLPALGAGAKIRIIELGAGTGATTERVLNTIGHLSERIDYTYTDISPAFLELGRSSVGARWNCFTFKVLNLEHSLEKQGFTPGSFDIVLATNVVHATKNLRNTLTSAKRLLKPNGWMVMNELTTVRAIVTIPGGVLDGWWLFEDEALRIPGSPLSKPQIWRGLLSEAGFHRIEAFGGSAVKGKILGQHVFVAESDGILPERMAAKPSAVPIIEQTPVVAEVKQPDVAVEGLIEQDIADAVKTVLRLDELALNRALADYGFDSLTGVKVVSALSELYATELSIDSFFEYPTVRELARHFAAQGIGPEGRAVTPEIAATPSMPATSSHAELRISESFHEVVPQSVRTPVDITQMKDTVAPLSAGQRGLYAFSQLAPQSYAYNLPLAFTVLAGLDVEALRRALQSIWDRHPGLRARFRQINGEVQQVFAAADAVWFERRVLPAGREEEHRTLVRAVMRQPFDLTTGPLMKAVLFEREAAKPILLLNFHHIVFDGMSIQLFLEELQGFYGFETTGKPFQPPLPKRNYADFVAWEQALLESSEGERLRRYWHDRLSGPIAPLELPTDRSHPAQPSFAGESVELELDPTLMRRLRSLASQQGTTMFSVMLAAYNLILNRYSGQTDILVGAPVAVRPDEFGDVLGYCINMAVLRSDLSGDPTFQELVQRLKTTVREAMDHARYPFIRIAEELGQRAGGGGNLLRAVFYFQNWVKAVQNVPLPLELYPGIHQEGEFDLTFEITDESDRCRFLLKYNPDLFDEATIRRMGAHYRHILEQVVDTPECRLSAFDLVTPAEQTVLKSWNATNTAYPEQFCLHELIDRQSLSTPQKCAVRFEGEQLSYGALTQRSNWLASHLQSLGLRPGMRAGIMLSRSLELPVVLLAVLKTGAAYVPLDPTYPVERLAYICGDADLKFIITDASASNVALSDAIVRIDLGSLRQRMTDNVLPMAPLGTSNPTDAAYVIYTSGSTGQPKGVEVGHRAVVNFLTAMQRTLGISALDRLLAVTTISFDIAGLELYLPLFVGGEVEIASSDMARDGRALAARLSSGEISVLQATPATWQMLISAGWRGGSRLKILCGGEALGQDLADRLLERSDDVWNLYGPTETTIWSSAKRLKHGEAVTIGRPIANTEFYVLDAHLKPVPIGMAGELYIGGDGLAHGYLNRPDLTAERFISHPFAQSSTARLYRTGDLAKYRADGEVVYLGRNDQQLKVRGFRVEAGDIEAALRKLDFIEDAVVVVRQERQLVGFATLRPHAALPAYEVWQEALGSLLPAHMIPAQLIAVQAFPQTLNRKIDRKHLAQAPLESLQQAQTTSDTAKVLPVSKDGMAQLTAELLAIVSAIVGLAERDIPLDAPFGQYGMDSVRFTELSVELGRRLNVNVGPNLFYQHASIRRLAAHLLATQTELTARFAQSPAPVLAASPAAVAAVTKPSLARHDDDAIAVVGMAGMFPQCDDLQAFWDALAEGRDLVSEIPADRWNWRDYQADANGKPISRWGGFLSQVDRFDPHVFGISPREAEWMDPQQRLMLEAVWSAVENAGQKPSDFAGSRTGVFVGVTNSDYGNLVNRLGAVEGHTLTGVAHTIIANRISFQFDLKGPSEVIDTACSSSLVAVRRAMEAIRAGHCDQAFAGGVNVILSPEIYVALSKANMLSPDGRCRAFDHRANGYVRGEGVGVVLLKRLGAARADGNPVLAILRGSAENHGGRANSLTAPNPNAQAELIVAAHRDAGFAAASITYREAHGTGTALGDPIEVDGLKAALEDLQPDGIATPCALGSVKTNIGHLEAAAGIAGLIKIILSMQHETIPASLHFERQNPNLDFGRSGLFVAQQKSAWNRQSDGQGGLYPRRAGISSFGFGGTNAHVIVEEAPVEPRPVETHAGPYLVLLSAKRDDRLIAAAERLRAFIDSPSISEADLASIAFTSQVGREAMDVRLALVVDHLGGLTAGLDAFIAGRHDMAAVYHGRVGAGGAGLGMLDGVSDTMAEVMIERRQIDGLARLWVSGVSVDFQKLYSTGQPKRMALPSYPFARQRYWLAEAPVAPGGVSRASGFDGLHPFIDSNCSTLDGVAFVKHVRPDDVVLRDHRIGNAPILPAVVYLEMARAAGEAARPGTRIRTISNLVWLNPVSFLAGETEGRDLIVNLQRKSSGTEYRMTSTVDGKTLTHAQGHLGFEDEAEKLEPLRVDLAAAQARCPDRLEGADCYRRLTERDFHYGPSFQVLRTLYRSANRDEVLAFIELAPTQAAELETVVLHPAVMDAALQTVSGLIGDGDGGLQLPFAAAAVTSFAPLQSHCRVHARTAGEAANATFFDVHITDTTGAVLVKIDRLQLRKIAPDTVRSDMQSVAHPPITIAYDWVASERFSPAAALGTVLVMADNPAVAATLQNSGRTERVVWIKTGAAFEARADGSFTLRTASEEDFSKAFERLQASNVIPEKILIITSPENAEQAVEQSFFRLAALSKALPRTFAGQKFDLLLLHGQDHQAAFGAIGGFAQTLAAENSNLALKCVSLDAMSDIAACITIALEEFSDFGEVGADIRYSHGQRWVKKPVHLDLKPGLAAMDLSGGPVLITGGAGALGLLFARHLLARGASSIALCGTRPLEGARASAIDSLRATGVDIRYYQADVSRPDDVHRLVNEIRNRQGPIIGVIHAAGVLQDGLILRQDRSAMERVLAPKVQGTRLLDAATASDPLRFFVMFSSTAARIGNPGQAAYGYANRFMTRFADQRATMVASGQRQGKSLALDWGLWRDGGMAPPTAALQAMETLFGMVPLEAETGLQAFDHALNSPLSEILISQGDGAKLLNVLTSAPPQPKPSPVPAKTDALVIRETWDMKPLVEEKLRLLFAQETRNEPEFIDLDEALESYGLDSVLVVQLSEALEATFGTLSKTIFYEHRSLRDLAAFLMNEFPTAARAWVGDASMPETVEPPVAVEPPAALVWEPPAALPKAEATAVETSDIAVIGIAGRYPLADDLDAFWRNLLEGRNCITEIPPERWDANEDFDPERGKIGKSYSKWGGFLTDVDKFDAALFQIPDGEADWIDPQERLFLETVWALLEDGGYTPRSLAALQSRNGQGAGVFVGSMYQHYPLVPADPQTGALLAGSSYWSIANRVSYHFNLQGPSLAVDSACSSSMTAIHMACQSLRAGETGIAIAGGVNLSIHRSKYQSLSLKGVIDQQDHSASLGQGSGYTPGEGVGAVLLKRLDDAIRDKDHIYAVIKASGVNHSGRTHGFTVPSPHAQTDLIVRTWKESGIDPRSLSYLEVAANGSNLGDPIEIAALSKAMRQFTDARNAMPIGAVKSNIGHLEAASGISQITKVLLQLKHGKLVPSINATPANPSLKLDDSPFFIQHEAADWMPANIDGKPQPRRAAISSFGAGGANSHLVIEEFVPQARSTADVGRIPQLILLSAMTQDQLTASAARLLAFLETEEAAALADVAYTLQVGRQALPARLALVVQDRDKLIARLTEVCKAGASAAGIGFALISGPRRAGTLTPPTGTLDAAALESLAKAWLEGTDVDWTALDRSADCQRIPLPHYPFLRKRHWVSEQANTVQPSEIKPQSAASLRVTTSANKVTSTDTIKRDETIMEDDKSLIANVRQHLLTMIADVLSVSATDLDPEDKFGDFGMDSLGFITFATRLNETYALDAHPTLLFTYPTVAELADHLISVRRDRFVVQRETQAPVLAEAVAESEAPAVVDDKSLIANARHQVMALIADVLSVAVDDLNPEDKFGDFGMDSLGFITFATRLNETYALDAHPTLLFTYPTVAELAEHLLSVRRDHFIGADHAQRQAPIELEPSPALVAPTIQKQPAPVSDMTGLEPVAIIGISGMFPQSPDLERFWQNLDAGRDLITEVPQERWDWRAFTEKSLQGKQAGRWGGFVADVDRFDADFFNLSPREAMVMDPQQRLFAETVWKSIEDAGYSPASLAGSRTGLFAGVSNFDYIEVLQEAGIALDGFAMLGNSHSILANRISYMLDLQGPSVVVDTACSSALIAIIKAVRSLQTSDCDLAIAGGVNLILNPNVYIAMVNSGMLSEDGRCKTFDRAANGYVRGEGVGAVVLKRLSAAERDGDHIYGVIRGTAHNHGGRTNSLTAPNPKAQADLIKAAWLEAGVSPDTASYIETHGTGTPLGDPIEVNGLKIAFNALYDHWSLPKPERPHCAIGSVKTNIGHLESGSGVAGLLKVILGMRHGVLPASLHCVEQNPYIELENSPFFIANERREWPRLTDADGKPVPRRAGVSSFGFGGANAHVVIEDYQAPAPTREVLHQPLLFVFSAKTQASLQAGLNAILSYLRQPPASQPVPSLSDIAFTLQKGRDAMSERLAIAARTREELVDNLASIVAGDMPEAARRGSLKSKSPSSQLLSLDDEDAALMVSNWIAKGKILRLAELWVNGAAIDWSLMPNQNKGRRVPLPTYVFAGQRHWPQKAAPLPVQQPAVVSPKHPLLGQQTVEGESIRFHRVFRADDVWLRDHVIGGRPLLPAVVMLEMAWAAASHVRQSSPVSIGDIVLLQPFQLTPGGAAGAKLTLTPEGSNYRFRVSMEGEAGNFTLCAEGKVFFTQSSEVSRVPQHIDLETIRQRSAITIDGEACYRGFSAAGYVYGPAFQAVRDIAADADGQVAIARLICPDLPDSTAFALHPSLLDGALQSVAGLVGGHARSDTLDLPFSIGQVHVLGTLPRDCFAHVSQSTQRPEGASKAYDVAITDEKGKVLAFISNYAFRPSRPQSMNSDGELQLFSPRWERKAAATTAPEPEHLLIFANASFADQLMADPARPTSWIVARHGSSFKVDNDTLCTVKADDRDQQSQLLEWLASKGRMPQMVVQVADDDVVAADFFGAVAFAQAEMQGKGGTALPIVHVHDDAAPAASHALSSALGSISQCLHYDMSRVGVKTLSVDFAGLSARTLVEAATKEGRNNGDSQEVRLATGERLVKRNAPLALDKASQKPTFRQGGTYIVTGGLGGLGLIVAEYLARTYGAKLVLCGRSPLSEAKALVLDDLRQKGGSVLYVQADIAVLSDTERLLAEAREQFGALHGILHAAGVLDDGPLARKSMEQMRTVLSPKIDGTFNLDHASRSDRLEVFVTFSSVAAVLGSPGQIDYAYGNAVMDRFATARRQMVEKGERFGRSLSINWPLWAEGGMGMDARAQTIMRQMTGMVPLPTHAGLRAMELALQTDADQIAVAQGDVEKIRSVFMPALPTAPAETLTAETNPDDDAQAGLEAILIGLFAKATGRADDTLDPTESLHIYGVDSIVIVELMPVLEARYSAISKTLFFEFQTIREIATHLLHRHPAQTQNWIDEVSPMSPSDAVRQVAPIAATITAPAILADDASPEVPEDAIAIIGVSGRYPQARDLAVFWDNLQSGRNCITPVPPERWNPADDFDPEKGKFGKSYSMWGGFIDEIACFDASFFNIPKEDARWIDPQERLFMQTAWETLEHAGMTPQRIADLQKSSRRGVGVFVGCMYQHYGRLARDEDINALLSTWSYWSIPNRISQMLNLTGPSLAVDTASSSSMVALHMACESIRRGESVMALAGGVNLSLDPGKYKSLSQRRVIAGTDKSMSLGEGDGYVPGEGVGAVLLRPLADAIRDGDPILAVIRSTAMNHSGRALGFMTPNLQAQADVITRALEQAGVDARTISWVEAAANGSPLGDPIEIGSLGNAFRRFTEDKQFCPIGTVKSNIGHLEAASGISQLTKVILQLQHGMLVPTLNAEPVNPNIDLEQSPFFIQKQASEWQRPKTVEGSREVEHPRRALVNSFGLGGANVIVVLEEYTKPAQTAQPEASAGPQLFVLSAKDGEALKRYGACYIDFLNRSDDLSLADLAYTSQLGRDAFASRLAILAADINSLRRSLQDWLNGRADNSTWQGDVLRANAPWPVERIGTDAPDWRAAAKAWTGGAIIRWAELHHGAAHKRIDLPTYPFARERHWLTDPLLAPGEENIASITPAAGILESAAVALHV